MKISAVSVVLIGGLGFVLGTLVTERRAPVALAQAGAAAQSSRPAPPANDGKLRIIVFGAHPDDAEYRGAGVAMKWAKAGHHVKLVSATNGDIGHWQTAGGPLAQRRTAEVAACSKILGTTSLVLDNHDGELEPTLENRKKIIRVIREWRADVVISHRPWDYHPDHRYVGVLVQDAAYMVTVPFICPDTPILKKNPVFMYSSDRFQKPYPFEPAVAVDCRACSPALDWVKVGLVLQPWVVANTPPSPAVRNGQPSAPKARSVESGALCTACTLASATERPARLARLRPPWPTAAPDEVTNDPACVSHDELSPPGELKPSKKVAPEAASAGRRPFRARSRTPASPACRAGCS